MRYGSPWSSGWGSPDNHFIYTIPDLAGMAASGNTYLPFKCKLFSGLDNAYVGVYLNAQFIKNVKIGTGQEYSGVVTIPPLSQTASLMPLRIGHLGDPSYTDEKVLRVYEGVVNGRVTVQFTHTPKIFVPPLSDGGYTSNWSLSGLVQGTNTALVQGHNSWGRMGLTITVSGGNCTVTLSSNGVMTATGTAAIGGAPFVVTLAAQNGSGVSGSVTISNTVANVTGGIVDARWPVSMQILRDTVDPPTTVRATLKFIGTNTVRWTEPLDLVTGTYYYRTQPVSDTGVIGAQTASAPITTIGPPAPPTNLAYSSGNAAATVLSFTGSSTSGATYRAYLATTIGGVKNMNKIQATAIAGATTITLPAITGYAGSTYVIVRAVFGGVEERNLNEIALEYDSAGNIVLPRPNLPGVQLENITITTGRTVVVKGLYNTDHEKGIASTLRLFQRTPSAAYSTDASGNLTGNVGTGGALASSGVKGIKSGTVTYTFPADGYYYITMLAATAGGTQSVSSGYSEVLILVSTDTLPAATGITATLSRG